MLAVATEGALVFLTMFPLAVFAKISEETKAYAYKDWVKKVEIVDRDGKTMKKKISVMWT